MGIGWALLDNTSYINLSWSKAMSERKSAFVYGDLIFYILLTRLLCGIILKELYLNNL